MTSAIVLAGGASTRFGGDKLSAALDGRPLLDHALEAVGAIANPVVVVIAPDAVSPPMPPALAHRVTVMRDVVAHRGPLAGLAAGLVALADIDRGDDAAAVVVGGDMPHLVPAVLELLAAAVDTDPGAGAATLEVDPPCVLPFAVRPSSAGPVVDALLRDDRRALRALIDLLTVAVVPAATWQALDPEGRTLDDVDTPADLERRRPGR
jgi:molybdopterin-guanine dinucleotide biosynthesis protein A